MESAEVLALVGGHVEQEILLRNEYLAAENAILKSKLEGRLRFTDEERVRLAKIGKRLGRKALADVGSIVKPDTILKWFRELVAKKFDGSKQRRYPGRPRVDPDVEKLVVRFAEANPTWGYDRIQGALANLGHEISDQTVGNILRRNGIPPPPTRSRNTTWADFIRAHADSIVATDFFTAEVLTGGGSVTFYILFFVHLASRRVRVAGITEHPDEKWMMQIARNETMVDCGFLKGRRFLIHDRDGKFCPAFQRIIKDAGVEPLKLPARSPNLNPVAERWVKSVKVETLSRLLFFSEDSLRQALIQYVAHHHKERNHQRSAPPTAVTRRRRRAAARQPGGGGGDDRTLTVLRQLSSVSRAWFVTNRRGDRVQRAPWRTAEVLLPEDWVALAPRTRSDELTENTSAVVAVKTVDPSLFRTTRVS